MEFVCCDCFENPGLSSFVANNAEEKKCNFCEAEAEVPIAADMETVATFFRKCIEREYDDAAEHLGYESAEGGYQGRHWDSYELIMEVLDIDLPNDREDKLLNRLVDSLSDRIWCEKNPFDLNPRELANFSWEEFCRVVKEERRYFFYDPNFQDDDADFNGNERITPAGTLAKIVEYAHHADLFKMLSPEVPLFRARKGSRWTESKDLGPPPNEKARQSRMSPAGIAMMYVSDHPHTALAEIRSDCRNSTIGCFRLTRPALILDLSEIRTTPSLFDCVSDAISFDERKILPFLNHVRYEMSHPIKQDDRVHLEYVPTQIVTEYLKYHAPIDGLAIEGIKYPSSVSRRNWSAVLFANRKNVVDIEEEDSLFSKSEKWIRMESITVQ